MSKIIVKHVRWNRQLIGTIAVQLVDGKLKAGVSLVHPKDQAIASRKEGRRLAIEKIGQAIEYPSREIVSTVNSSYTNRWRQITTYHLNYQNFMRQEIENAFSIAKKYFKV